jgi:hypothetical protein
MPETSRAPKLRTRRSRATSAGAVARSSPAESRSAGWQPRSRVALFALLCVTSLLVAGGYAAMAADRAESARRRPIADDAPERLASLTRAPHLLFLDSDGGPYRRVAVTSLDEPSGERVFTTLECQRVYSAAGQGLCLGTSQNGGASTFGPDFRPRHALEIGGIPSRARVSPDGRYGAMTVFVTGHDYTTGTFSTQTVVIDMASGSVLAELEQFAVYRDGARIQAADFNFWGVTFRQDSNHFYATLASAGTTYLIEGDVEAREARVLRENVECPSISPDNTRIAFKKRMDNGPGPAVWRFHVLDLQTMDETPLAETRNVDDQAEWLDDGRIAYFLRDEGPPATIRPDLWSVAADGSGTPRMLQEGAFSPATVR